MISTEGPWFKDEHGRTLILRGANLGGSTKVPYHPNGATYIREGFYDHRDVSFVGRPFPLTEADEHLRRLRAWGMTFLRFLITWEAVEHAGPGEYDEEYLDYVRAVIKKAGQYGIDVFIDPHQDVWSRFTGGDGAPGWTLEAVGMDVTKLAVTGAAILHQEHGDPFPRMIWPTNYDRYGAATMFTLFFAGNGLAPATAIDGVPVQEYLQGHYIAAVKQVALRINDLPNVAGYDSLNEPDHGYIGVADAGAPTVTMLKIGPMPSPFQAMLLASGYPQDVDVHEFGLRMRKSGTQRINPNRASLWRPGCECVWKQNGVWTNEDGSPRLLRPDHFARVNGRTVDFAADYLKPFIARFAEEIRAVHPGTLLFTESAPTGSGHLSWGPDDPAGAVNAGHWYDALTLLTKHFNDRVTVDAYTRRPVLGSGAIGRMYTRQLGRLKADATDHMNNIPTLVGEFGVPFDLDSKAAYRSGDFAKHVKTLDAYYDAMDANLLSCTIWNYTADNSNSRGDLWNDEDLSVFSRDQQADPADINSGGRALAGIVRPYAVKIAGEPLRMAFDLKTRVFELSYRGAADVSALTEIFAPDIQYPQGYRVEVPGGTYDINRGAQMLTVCHAPARDIQTVRISPI